jgi:hypothetical protein
MKYRRNIEKITYAFEISVHDMLPMQILEAHGYI